MTIQSFINSILKKEEPKTVEDQFVISKPESPIPVIETPIPSIVPVEAPKSEPVRERLSSSEVYDDLQAKKYEYRNLDGQIRMAQDEVNQLRQRGLAVSWAKNPPGSLASAAGTGGVTAINHAKQRGIRAFEEYRAQKKLAEERLGNLTKRKPELEYEIRQLETKFSAAVRIELAEKEIS